MPALSDVEALLAGVNQGPAVIFRWRIAPDEWPVVMVTDNVRMFGYEADDFLSGRVSWPGITHPEDAARLEKEVGGHLAAGRDEFAQEYRLFTGSGETRWVEDRNIVIRDAEGRPAYIQGVVMDSTPRKEAEQLRGRQEARLRKLAARLARAQDEEQKRISEGLHDDVAQLLTACMMRMRAAGRMDDPDKARNVYAEAEQMIREVTEKIRDLSFELGSSTLHRLGLTQAFQELCDQMERRHGVHFRLDAEPVGTLDEARMTVLFKAARELLFNVVKHADVTHAHVVIRPLDGQVTIAVEDRGRGFPSLVRGEPDSERSGGLGLFGIRERLRDIGGAVWIESEPGVRTRVTITAPRDDD